MAARILVVDAHADSRLWLAEDLPQNGAVLSFGRDPLSCGSNLQSPNQLIIHTANSQSTHDPSP